MSILIDTALIVLLCMLPLSLIQLIKGPSVFDRLVCYDALSVTIIGIILTLSMKWQSTNFLDIILVFSMFGFFSTVAFVYYLHKTYPIEKGEKT